MVLLPTLVIYAPALRALMFVLAPQGGREGILKKVFNDVSKCEVLSRKAEAGSQARGVSPAGMPDWCPVAVCGFSCLWKRAEPAGLSHQLLHRLSSEKEATLICLGSNTLSALSPLPPEPPFLSL